MFELILLTIITYFLTKYNYDSQYNDDKTTKTKNVS